MAPTEDDRAEMEKVLTGEAFGTLCMCRAGEHVPGDSVVCRGRARVVADLDERAVELNAFLRRYAKDARPLTLDRVKGCTCIVVAIDEMTGRHEREGREVVTRRWRR